MAWPTGAGDRPFAGRGNAGRPARGCAATAVSRRPLSEPETAAAVESYGISPDRIAIVPPGTAKPNRHLRPRRRRVRALLCVANLVPRKGHRVLVEALARIPRRGGSGNALTVPGKARDRRPRGAVRGGFGSEPASARRDRRADGVPFLPGARSFTNAATSSGGYDAGCHRRRSSTGSGR
jgi:glycosyltransferase involved in cell wall biosynthesis